MAPTRQKILLKKNPNPGGLKKKKILPRNFKKKVYPPGPKFGKNFPPRKAPKLLEKREIAAPKKKAKEINVT